MSLSLSKATLHYATPEQIRRANAASSPLEKLNALYERDQSAAVRQRFTDWNITLAMAEKIAKALIFRNEYVTPALAAIQQLEALGMHSQAFQDVIASMHALQGKFLGIFVSDEIPQAMHHTLAHGVDMSQDSADYLTRVLMAGSNQRDAAVELAAAMVGMLGAAHDIVQGKSPPPTNEIESAEIFCMELQQVLARLLKEHAATYSSQEVAAIETYSQVAVPFLAEEGIINSTHLMFTSGKRTLDSVLAQISGLYIGDVPDLPPYIAAMKLALSVPDTRRGEMVYLIDRLESLTIMIQRGFAREMTWFLQAADIFTGDDALPENADDLKKWQGPARKKVQTAEGFILRLRASLNMVSELARHSERDATGHSVQLPDPTGTELTHRLRGKAIAGSEADYENLLDQFIARINASSEVELRFAEAMSSLRQELFEQAERYGIAGMLDQQYLNSEWDTQVSQLITLKNNLVKLSHADKAAMAKVMYTMAAVSPGLILGMGMTQALYEGLVGYEHELYQRGKHSDKLKRLSREISEVEGLNAEALRLVDRPEGCRK